MNRRDFTPVNLPVAFASRPVAFVNAPVSPVRPTGRPFGADAVGARDLDTTTYSLNGRQRARRERRELRRYHGPRRIFLVVTSDLGHLSRKLGA